MGLQVATEDKIVRSSCSFKLLPPLLYEYFLSNVSEGPQVVMSAPVVVTCVLTAQAMWTLLNQTFIS